PVRLGARVDNVRKRDGVFFVTTPVGRYVAENVVVAMADYQRPRVPPFARDLDPAINQLHARDYRNTSQLLPGAVLVVGAGNSGAEIAIEAAAGHAVFLSGRDTGHLPFGIEGAVYRYGL